MINIELTEHEANFVLQAVDQAVRATGLANAATGLCVAAKLQEAGKPAEAEPGSDAD